MVDYKENATDGDDDGFVQDATPFERPIGSKIEDNNIVPAVVVEGESIIPEKFFTDEEQDKIKKYIKKEVTCVISERNLYLPGVGRLIKGKNEINPDKAEAWLNVEGVKAC